MGYLPQRLGRVLGVALDTLLPPQCLNCGSLVDSPGSLCAACWERVGFLGPPLCAACGLPFELDAGPGALCAECLGGGHDFARARAVFRYDDAAKGMVLRLKHADRTDSAPAFARWMARAGADLLAEAELLVPVPLHWLRLFRRRYNQAALLACALSDLGGVPVAPQALVRKRATPAQGNLGRLARQRNVRGAFALGRRAARLVEGRRVLLVDDVLTTGATVGECARVLRAGGAAAVDVLTLARVVLPHG